MLLGSSLNKVIRQAADGLTACIKDLILVQGREPMNGRVSMALRRHGRADSGSSLCKSTGCGSETSLSNTLDELNSAKFNVPT